MKISTILYGCAVATTCLADFSVYTRALAGQEAVKLGDVQMDSETGEPVLTLSEQIEQATEGTNCIGVKSAQGEFVCSSLVELERPLHYSLVISVKPNDEFISVALQPSEAEGIVPVVQRSVQAAEPNLKSQQRLGQKGSSARPAGEAADDDEQLVSIAFFSFFRTHTNRPAARKVLHPEILDVHCARPHNVPAHLERARRVQVAE